MVGSVVVFFWQALNVIMTMMTWTKYLDIPYKIPIGIMYVDIHFCATMMMMMIKRRICNGTCNYREIEKPQTKYLLSPSVSGPVCTITFCTFEDIMIIWSCVQHFYGIMDFFDEGKICWQ